MNKTKYISFLIALVLGITLFFSCKKKPDMPPVTPYDIGNTITIQQLRDLFLSKGCNNYKFTKDVSLYATITMDASSGNIYKMVYLRDNTGTISMKQLSAGGLFVGDSIRINLRNAYLDKASSGSFLQIDSVDVNSPYSKVVKLAVQKNPAPVVVTIPQLLNSVTSNTCSMAQSIYDGQLIQLNDVMFAVNDTGLYYNNSNTHAPISTSYTLTDCGAQNSIGFYTSSFATDFYNTKVPSGSGSVIAVASFYSGVLQLSLRSISEANLNQPRCGVDTMTQNFVNCINSANFATAIPGWYNQSQLGYLYWVGTGGTPPGYPSATNFGGQTRNVMWLITPAIQNSATKNLSFKTAYSYPSASHPMQLSVLISTDYNGTNLGGTVPSSNPAHWYDITSAFPLIQNGSAGVQNWFTAASSAPVILSQISTVSALLSSYSGTFYIGFRYTGHAGTDSTQTMSINNVIIKN